MESIDKKCCCGMERREFLRRAGGTAALAAVAGGGAALFHDRDTGLVTGGGGITARGVELRSFAVDREVGAVEMAIAHGDDPAAMLPGAMKAMGGMESFIQKGDVVVIKPNVAFASPPLIGATANPELVAAAVQMVKDAGAARVIVTDNPIHQPGRCFAQSGIGPAAQKAGAELYLPTESSFRPLTVKGGELIREWPFLYVPFEKATKVIGIAPVKDHSRARASMSLKNWYGLLGGRRNQFHQDIHNIIKELAMMLTPTLVILDGTRVMMRHGPTGGSLSDLAAKRTLIVSTDAVAADAAGYELLERNPAELEYLRMATERNLGTYEYKKKRYVEFDAGI